MVALYPGSTTFPGPSTFPGTADGSNSTDPALTATVDPTNSPPRVLLQIVNSTAASGQVLRYGPDGRAVAVRAGDPATLSSGVWVGYDVEAPFNQPVHYEFAPTSGAHLTSATVTLQVAGPWFIHPGVPDLSQPITVKLLDEETLASGGGLHPVLGRATPIPVTDGMRKSAAFQMLLKTGGADARAALDQLFMDTAPLLLQVVYPDQTGESVYQWVSVGEIRRGRKSLVFGDTTRIWTLQCTEVARPVGGIRSQRTWTDVMAECPTWNDVLQRYQTWRGVLTGIQGT